MRQVRNCVLRFLLNGNVRQRGRNAFSAGMIKSLFKKCTLVIQGTNDEGFLFSPLPFVSKTLGPDSASRKPFSMSYTGGEHEELNVSIKSQSSKSKGSKD